MTKSVFFLSAVFPFLLLAGCSSLPSGPSVMALPGTGKNFEQFRADEADCRQYAKYQTGGADAEHAAIDSGVRSAAVGTVVGAVAGAAIGGHEGAGVGAGAGLVVGSMAGANAAPSSAYGAQRNYDNAYIQCMYAKGHKVPVSGSVARSRTQAPAETSPSAPAPSSGYYPPPPGYQPPPAVR